MSDQAVVHQVTIRVLDSQGFSEYYTLKAATVNELVNNVKFFKDWLKTQGYTPDAGGPTGGHHNGHSPAVAANGASTNGAAGEHYCNVHTKTKMLQSQHRSNELYCPEKISDVGGGSDGSKPIYCKCKVKL